MASLLDPRVSNPVLSSLKIKHDDKIIFVKENSLADSNFIITHLLKQILYEKNCAFFLTLHNTFDHYQNVGKKLGYDLKQAVEKGEVKVLDPLEEVIDNIGRELEENPDYPIGQIPKCLLNSIKKGIDNLLTSKKQAVYLIIDDISHFLDLGIELSQVVSFTNACVNLACDDDVFVVINSHVSSCESDLIVAHSVQYICDVLIEVSPLCTGKSTDITGVMRIQRGGVEDSYHFRAFDRGVKTFHPGETIYNLYK